MRCITAGFGSIQQCELLWAIMAIQVAQQLADVLDAEV